MNVDIAVVSAKHQMSICVMVTLVILTIYMEMTMSKIIGRDYRDVVDEVEELIVNAISESDEKLAKIASIVGLEVKPIGRGLYEVRKMVSSEREFIEKVYEIAFGDDAINRHFTYGEVLEELRDNSDRAWGISKDGR